MFLRYSKKDALTADIPAVALSANAMERDIEKGLAVGFDRCLTKPIEVSQLVEVLDHFVCMPT